MSIATLFQDQDLHVERELLAVVAGLRLKLDAREAVFCLLNDEAEAPYLPVLGYFLEPFEEALTELEARLIWLALLDYRLEMCGIYGQRISLHIAMYHFTRDPEFVGKRGLRSGLKCAPLVQRLAIQELKAWWERCSETGVHLREVMDQQLDRLTYHALKANHPISLVLLRVSGDAGPLSAQKRVDVAQFLMDACRCRDIVGHYEEDFFALIFPQTPRQGARIAVERIRSFFHKKFNDEKYTMVCAIANCPENGREGRALSLSSIDVIRQYGKAQDDVILECEGEPRWLYQLWVFQIKDPLKKFLTSPLKVAAAILLIALGVYAAQQLNFSMSRNWNVVLKQEASEQGALPRWNWGRGNGDSFPLEARDGLLSSSGELILEESGDFWYRFPCELRGDVRVSMKFKMCAGTSFSWCLGPKPSQKALALEFSLTSCTVLRDGVVLDVLPWSIDPLQECHLQVVFSPSGMELQLDDELLLEGGRWSVGEAWPKQGFFTVNSGYALVKEVQMSVRGDGDGGEIQDDRWLRDILNLKGSDPSAWAEKMLRAPARLEPVLRGNLERALLEHDVLQDHEQRKAWVLQWGETVLGGPKIWLSWLKDFEASALSAFWGQDILERSMSLKVLSQAGLSQRPVELLSSYANDELWGMSRDLFLKTVLKIDWGRHRFDVAQWAWEERLKELEELPRRGRLELGLDFLIDELVPEDPQWMKTVCDWLLRDGMVRPQAVFKRISGNPLAMQVVMDMEGGADRFLLKLLQAKGTPVGFERRDLLSGISSWVNNTEFGKMLLFDWMWLQLENEGLQTREGQFFHQVLSQQSRNPDLARAAMAMIRQ